MASKKETAVRRSFQNGLQPSLSDVLTLLNVIDRERRARLAASEYYHAIQKEDRIAAGLRLKIALDELE